MNKITLAAVVAASVLTLSIPAAAETFTASNGVLSIDLPNESWKEIEDPATWIVLSDGANMITIDHFSNGEKLPEITVADDHYVNVYQAAFSTQNEVFIITGSVVDAAKIPEIANSIISAKVLQYDTKVKVNKEESEKPAEEEITVQPADQTMYVISDELNVRSGCSTSDQILGSMVNGQSVQVTGIVQKNGTDNGWVQIAFNGGSGYVSSAYLSDQAPAEDSAGKAPEGLTYTGAATTVYAMSGTAVTIYEASDGNWYDKSGTLFTWQTESKLTNAGGDSFTTTPTGGDSYFTGVTQTVYSLSGTPVTIRESTDGYWYTDSGVRMTWIDYEKLESEGGEAFTLHNLAGTGTDVSEIEGKIYCPYCGNYYEQGNEFRNHVCPERDAALAPED